VVPLRIEHPFWMILFLVLTSVTFSLIGFIIGIWADGFENSRPYRSDHHAAHLSRRQLLLHRHAAAFLADGLALQPVVYLVSGFRWSFYASPT